MGIEFIRKIAKPYRKSLDRRRAELATPDFFTRQPDNIPRTFAAKLHKGHAVVSGEQLSICSDGERITVLRGLDAVGTLINPTAELMSALSQSHGEACGQVREIHDIAGIAEITI